MLQNFYKLYRIIHGSRITKFAMIFWLSNLVLWLANIKGHLKS